MNTKTRQRDGNEIAAEYDELICLMLVLFGYLTARMSAALIRGTDDPKDVRAAQRRLRSLSARKLVSRERLDNGIWVYRLTQRGALFLIDLGYEHIPKRGTRDARTGNYFHRALTNNYLIFNREDFIQFWPEHSVLKGRAPFRYMSFEGKDMVPDALALLKDDQVEDNGASLLWIEAENAAKSPKRLQQIARLADYVLNPKSPYGGVAGDHSHRIQQFLFICPSIARARAVVRAFAPLLTYPEIVERTEIFVAPMGRSLVWPYMDDCWSGTVFDLGVQLNLIEPPSGYSADNATDQEDGPDSDEILEGMYGKEYENEFAEDFGEETPQALEAFEKWMLSVQQAHEDWPTDEAYWVDYEPELREEFEDDDDIVEEYPELV